MKGIYGIFAIFFFALRTGTDVSIDLELCADANPRLVTAGTAPDYATQVVTELAKARALGHTPLGIAQDNQRREYGSQHRASVKNRRPYPDVQAPSKSEKSRKTASSLARTVQGDSADNSTLLMQLYRWSTSPHHLCRFIGRRVRIMDPTVRRLQFSPKTASVQYLPLGSLSAEDSKQAGPPPHTDTAGSSSWSITSLPRFVTALHNLCIVGPVKVDALLVRDKRKARCRVW